MPAFTSTVTGYNYQDNAANVIASGPAYTILNNQSQVVTGTPPAGTYQIVPSVNLVTSSNYFTQYANGVFTQPALLTLSATATQPNCFGQTGSVVLNGSGGTGALTYSGDATSGLGAGTYSYLVTDANGCTGTATATINAAPAQLVISAIATQPNCYGQKGSVVRTSTGGTPPYTYNSTATTNLSAGTYTYTVTDSKGCSATTSATIVVPTQLTGTTSTTPASCNQANGSATTAPSGGTSPYAYLWTPGNATSQTISNKSAGTYCVVITDSKGCTKSLTATISTTNIAAPGSISGPVNNLCNTAGKVYTIAAVPGATSYTWSVPSGASFTSNSGTSITVCYGSNFKTTGTVKVKANCACNSSAYTTLAVSAAPPQPGAITGSASVCKTQTAIPYSISSVTGATSYKWTITGGAIFNGSTTSLSSSVKYTTATSSAATLSVVAKNSCSSSVARTLAIAVNLSCRVTEQGNIIEEEIVSDEIQVYPNPSFGELNVRFTAGDNENFSFKVIDVLGKTLAQSTYNSIQGENIQQLDLNKLPSGIYFLCIEKQGNKIHTKRFVIE
ncbi:MAG: T9SS type A sorting domain-containing protein [Bacteroidetes bacterium]|nr:T9SS type A sorting domain-containing protein [Bacteroidota bacterium]